MTFDPTSILKDWGVTLGALAVVAFIATLVLIFSLREFAFWFLRINQVMKKQDALLEKIDNLEASLRKAGASSAAGSISKTPGPASSVENEVQPKKKFPIAKAESLAGENPEFHLLN